MARNKYVYTHSKATFVVASSSSGGTWEGVLENVKNQWVPTFVRCDESVPLGNKLLIEKFKDSPFLLRYNFSDKESIVEQIREVLQMNNLSKKAVAEKVINRDVYPLILPTLKKALSDKKSIHEVSLELNVNLEQMQVWFKRFKENEDLEKENHAVTAIQETLF